jgi:Tol biopolymer transport system component
MDPAGTARQHSGNADWFPSGEYFVFTSQNRGSTDYRRSIPGMGWHCNLWLADKDGTKFWQLTNISTSYNSPQGVAMPHFAPDGKRLFWAGNTGKHSPESPWEQRALYLADFGFKGGRPELSNIQEFQPGKQRDFYESYGFSPDGNRIYFAGNLEEDQPWYGMNIYTLEKGAEEAITLTPTSQAWDRFASVSPDGRKIVWSSSSEFDIRYLGTGGSRWARYLRTELWIMDADGQNPKQLTQFNTPGTREYVGRRAFVGDTAWSPDGNRLALVLHYETRNFDVDSKVLMVDLGKGPLEEQQAETGNGTNGATDGTGGLIPGRRPAPKVTPALPQW